MTQPIDSSPNALHAAPTRWVKLTAIGAFATPFLLLGAIAFGWRTQREASLKQSEALATLQTELRSVAAEVRSGHSAAWVDLKELESNCFATNGEVTCTFVNLRDTPVTTCALGRIQSKKSGALQLASLPMCTGRLGARETRTVSAPLVGGRAKDLCNSPSRFGGTELDWDQCDFEVERFDAGAKGEAKRPAPAPDAHP